LKARRLLVIGLVLLAAVVPAGQAGAALADRIGATFGDMAEEFVNAFRPLEGIVIAGEDGEIFVDVGEARGAQVGQEYTVFRKGETFTHPLTGKALGRYEEVLGHAQIRQVAPQFSQGVFVPAPGKPAPRAEDGVRISRARLKLAITPVLDLTGGKGDLRRVPYLIATALERSRRFQVVDLLALTDTFAAGTIKVEEVLSRPERAIRAARNLEVAGWLVPVLLERRGTLYLDVTWISAISGTALFSRRQPLIPVAAIEEQRFPWEPPAED
jgi:hypothetical protein